MLDNLIKNKQTKSNFMTKSNWCIKYIFKKFKLNCDMWINASKKIITWNETQNLNRENFQNEIIISNRSRIISFHWRLRYRINVNLSWMQLNVFCSKTLNCNWERRKKLISIRDRKTHKMRFWFKWKYKLEKKRERHNEL